MDALAGQGVEVGGQGSHQGFALAGLHLGDAALVEHHAAHQLHPVGPQAQHPHGGLPHRGEGLGQEVVQGLAVVQAALEFHGLGGQLGVAHRLIGRLQRLNLVHHRVNLLQLPFAVGSKKFCNQAHDRNSSFVSAPKGTHGYSLVYHRIRIMQREKADGRIFLPEITGGRSAAFP